MRNYKQEDWYKREVNKYVAQYADVPPPWVFAPDSHPYSIQWRMGAGETFIMVFWGWAKDELKHEQERIDHLKKYPPPPRWLAWAVDFVWNLQDDVDYEPYFEKLKNLGFEGTDEYERDLNDERWL